ncbi:MAG: GatB/YqeY domain-containing protein [Actinomycetales bacterium]
MPGIKEQLQANLTAAMKARDELRSATIRMALAAITNEEVAGKQARTLSDDEVIGVLSKEAKKRREAAEAYEQANRQDLADRELAELGVLAEWLPQPLSQEELSAIVQAAVAQATADGASGPGALGAVMKIVQPQVKGRADGGQVAAMVKQALTG